jgi:hypothetical protein
LKIAGVACPGSKGPSLAEVVMCGMNDFAAAFKTACALIVGFDAELRDAIYQQNTQAAKTTPVVASRTRTINASFMIRLR